MLYELSLALLFVITGVPLKLIDSSWYGRIKAVDIKDGFGFTNEPLQELTEKYMQS